MIALVLTAAIGAGLFGLHFWEKAQLAREAARLDAEEDTFPERLTVYYQGSWYRLRDGLDTYLLLGVDKSSEEAPANTSSKNDQMSDFLFLVIADRHNSSCTALHLNRDTMTEVQMLDASGRVIVSEEMQLCYAHSYGSGGKDSCRNTVKTVSRLLYDVPIEHYFALTMDAIPVLNDLVGGVTVHLDEDLTQLGPEFTEGADVHLMGEQSLRYVRARMSVSDGSNLSRMHRQRTYLDALYQKLLEKLQDTSFALQLAEGLTPYSTSDLITDELARLLNQLHDYSFSGIEETEGEAVLGEKYTEFYLNEDALQAQVIRLFFEPISKQPDL